MSTYLSNEFPLLGVVRENPLNIHVSRVTKQEVLRDLADTTWTFVGNKVRGCWSPLFPARYDDVVLAAAVCVKELETLAAKRPREPRFRVFAQASSDDGFQGFAPENAPPGLEALAS